MASLPYVSNSVQESPGPVQSNEGAHTVSKPDEQINGYLDHTKSKLTGLNTASLDVFGSVITTKPLSGRVYKKSRGQRVGIHRRSESVPDIIPRQYDKDSEETQAPGTSTIVSSPVMMAYEQGHESRSSHVPSYEVSSSGVHAPQFDPVELHKTFAPKIMSEPRAYQINTTESVPQDRHSASIVPCSYIPNSDMKWVPTSGSGIQDATQEQTKGASREENDGLMPAVEESSREPFVLGRNMGDMNSETSRKDTYKDYGVNSDSYSLESHAVSPKKDSSSLSYNEKVEAPYRKWNETSTIEDVTDPLTQYQQNEAPSVSHLVEAAHQIQQFHAAPQGHRSYVPNAIPNYDMRYSSFGYPPPLYIAAPAPYHVYPQGNGPVDPYNTEQHDVNQSSSTGAINSMSSPAWVQLAPPPQPSIHSVVPLPMTDLIAQNDRVQKSHRRSRSKSQHARSKSLSRVLDVSNMIYAPTSVLGLGQQPIAEDEQDLVGGNYWGIISTSDSEDAPPIPIQLCEPPLSDSVPANVEALKPDPEPRNKKRSKYTPEQDSIILELKAAGANWAEIAERANCDNSLAARNRYQVLIGQQGGGTYTWNQSDCEALQSLLDEGERAKWIFIAEEMTKRRNKKYTIEACHYKISQLFAENPEAFEVVRSREKIGGGAPMRHRPLRLSSRRPSSSG